MEPAPERQHHRRKFGGGIGIGEISSQRSAVADLGMSDMGKCLADQRQVAPDGIVALELAITRERADPQISARRACHARKLGKRVDVDQDVRPRQAEIKRRNKALAAGQEARVVAIFGLERQCLIERPCGNVLERSGLHAGYSILGPLRLWKNLCIEVKSEFVCHD